MRLKYFDIHSHIDFPAFDLDREVVIQRMHDEGVGTIAVGIDLKTSKEVVELADRYENIYAAVGLHPTEISCGDFGQLMYKDFNSDDYKEIVKNKKVVAIGECGLDYFRIKIDKKDGIKKKQKENFIKQIEFALENNLPLMLHFRPTKQTMDAYEDGFEILEKYKKEYKEKLRGNLHFFAGDLNITKKFLSIGFTFSFTGVITFTDNYDEIIKYIPLDMLMVETDCPFVPPIPYRGKRCEPIYVKEIVKHIAKIRSEEYDKTKDIIADNAIRIFLSFKNSLK